MYNITCICVSGTKGIEDKHGRVCWGAEFVWTFISTIFQMRRAVLGRISVIHRETVWVTTRTGLHRKWQHWEENHLQRRTMWLLPHRQMQYETKKRLIHWNSAGAYIHQFQIDFHERQAFTVTYDAQIYQHKPSCVIRFVQSLMGLCDRCVYGKYIERSIF